MGFSVPDNTGILYVIGTPIGNLHDISKRAKQILRETDLILAEDTRHSRKLLEHLCISTPMQSYHDFNERGVIPGLLDLLQQGKYLALISDAGTPLISDPGYQLVKAAHEHGIRLVPIPGPSALLAALSIAGMATDKFIFEGFLPVKHAARKKRLQNLLRETRTMVFYEAPHRIIEFLEEICELYGRDRMICVCRELTKKFETVYRGAVGEVITTLQKDPLQQKGEFVVVIEGNRDSMTDFDENKRIITSLLKHGVSVKSASSIAAEITGAGKNDLYKLALKLNDD